MRVSGLVDSGPHPTEESVGAFSVTEDLKRVPSPLGFVVHIPTPERHPTFSGILLGKPLSAVCSLIPSTSNLSAGYLNPSLRKSRGYRHRATLPRHLTGPTNRTLIFQVPAQVSWQGGKGKASLQDATN